MMPEWVTAETVWTILGLWALIAMLAIGLGCFLDHKFRQETKIKKLEQGRLFGAQKAHKGRGCAVTRSE